MNVIAFKLSNGDEIISEMISSSDKGFEIKRPLQLKMQMTQGGPQLGFFPWAIMLEEQTVHLESHHVVVSFEPADQVKNDYIKSVTGLDIVSTPTQILHS